MSACFVAPLASLASSLALASSSGAVAVLRGLRGVPAAQAQESCSLLCLSMPRCRVARGPACGSRDCASPALRSPVRLRLRTLLSAHSSAFSGLVSAGACAAASGPLGGAPCDVRARASTPSVLCCRLLSLPPTPAPCHPLGRPCSTPWASCAAPFRPRRVRHRRPRPRRPAKPTPSCASD
ncbi:hypothetical protein DMC30DRAFT_394797 [Rhodotorula diobovata]|uniref:Secreted protein n=1 Tax=Rhodotorula diobovata TaxID=5288 RepID=A0A5C5FZK6_9BASI|nr:hypothetical protein DMC30DRAFT_394797 [Rhodotorula diobovata]